MDKLEEYIMKHREEMDRLKPSSGIWKRIRKGLKNNRSGYRWISVAAMLAIILGASVVFLKPVYKLIRKSNGDGVQLMSNQTRFQLKETEIYYNNLANSLYREATPMLAKNPEIQKELYADISQIDSICSEIKKDLKDNVANKEVIEALVQNYRIKIRLLEDMLEILKENEKNPEKSKNDEL
jgi:hypothetical protein